MLGQDLPPIGAKLTGEIGDLMAKLVIVREEIKRLKAEASSSTDLRLAKDLETELNKMARTMKQDLIGKAVRDSIKRADPEYQNAGNSAAQRFLAGWKAAMKKERGPNGRAAGWLPWIGAAMPIVPAAITGAAGVIGGLGVAAGATAAGLGALASAASEVLAPVKQAFTAIDKLTTTNAVGANATALRTWLSGTTTAATGSKAVQVQQRIIAEQMRIAATQARIAAAKTPASRASAQATLLVEQGVLSRYQGQITPTRNSLGPGLGFLANPNVNWYTLTPQQQRTLVTAAQSTTGMPASEKAQISALMQERQAYTALNKPQQRALFQYTRFDNAMVKAQNAAQPAVLGLFGAGLGAITPLLKYITPLANTAAKALMPLVKEVGGGFKSSGFKDFMSLLIKLSGSSIKTFGQALINVGIGIGHIFSGIGKSGLAGQMANDVLKMATAFKNWTGGKGFTQFLGQMKTNAPTVVAILHNLVSIIGSLVKNLSGGLGHLELTGLNLLLHLLADLAKLPLGGFLYNVAALVLLFSKFGSLRVVGALWDMLYKTLLKFVALRFSTFIAGLLGIQTEGMKLGEVWSGIGNKVWSGVQTAMSATGNWVKSAATNFGSMIASGAKYVAQLGKQLVEAAAATATWIAEHAVATASFIAQNVAQAASATAAFIAENAATLGIAAAIAALVVAIVFLATHWRQVWNDIKHWAMDAWEFLTHGWGQWIFPELTAIRLAVAFLRDHWRTIWDDIKRAAMDWWHWFGGAFVVSLIDWLVHKIPGAFDAAVRAIGAAWNVIKQVVMDPIDWVVRYVIDDVLIKAFDWVSHAVGGPTISPIKIPGMARGGRITQGTGPIADDVLVRVSRNETILSANDSKQLSPLLGMMGVPGYARGGVPSPGNPFPKGLERGTSRSDPFSLFGKLFDVAKMATAVITGNSTALMNNFMKLIGKSGSGSGAKGDMAKLLTAVPGTLVKAAVKWLIGNYGGGSNSAIVRYAESFIGKSPYLWGGTTPSGWDCSGFVEWVYRHFGYNNIPRTAAEQHNWALRVAQPVPGGLAFFTGADGTMQNPGHVGIVVSHNRMVDAYGTGFGTRFNSLVGSSGAIVGFGVPPRGLRGGGKGIGVGAGGTVQSWLEQAISLTGAPGSWLRGLEEVQQAETDSLPNKTTVVNPNGGATGLMQVKPGTYAAFATSPGGITNPVSNAVAAIRYIMSQYGSVYNIPGLGTSSYQGYDSGGWLKPGMRGVNMGSRPEAVLTPDQSQAFTMFARSLAGGGGAGGGGGPAGNRLNNLFHYWEEHFKKWISEHKPYKDLHGAALEKYWQEHWGKWIKDNIGKHGGSGGGGGHHRHLKPLTKEERTGLGLAHYYATDQNRTIASIRKEEKDYLKDIAKYYHGADRRKHEDEIRKQTNHLIAIRTSLNKIDTRLSNAKAYQQQVMSNLSGYADLSNYTLGSAVIHGKNSTPGQFLAYQQKQSLGNLKKFGADIKKLSQMKAPGWLIQQVVGMGVDQGTQYADEIIAGGTGLIKQLNKTEQQINKEELGISRGAASAVYEGRYNTSKNFLTGLEKDRARLEKLFKEVGDKMGREAAKWFHVPRGRLPKGMAAGGLITEPIFGIGASGQTYMFGENTTQGINEQVTPLAGGTMRQRGFNINVYTNEIKPQYHAAMLGFELARRSG